MAAQETYLRHHVIVAIDKAGCNTWIREGYVANAVCELLYNYPTDSSLYYRKSLITDGDYLSFVGFTIKPYERDMSTYMLSRGTNPLVYQNHKNRTYIKRNWENIVGDPVGGNNNFSLVSVAKPYALMALNDRSKTVNRTFVILITDHRYNGGDFYEEIKAFQIQSGGQLTYESIYKKCYEVEQNYFIRYIKSTQLSIGYGKTGYVELYEYVPLQQHFSLSLIIDHNPTIKAKRSRDGSYEASVNLNQMNNAQYKIERIEIFPTNNDTSTYSTPQELTTIILESTEIDTTLTYFLHDKTAKKFEMRAWVRLNDNVYNATVLTPLEQSPKEYGRNGLNILIPIEYEKERLIYNLITLKTWMWPSFIESQDGAILFWEIILPILVILFFILNIRFAPTYHPGKGDFKLIKFNKHDKKGNKI